MFPTLLALLLAAALAYGGGLPVRTMGHFGGSTGTGSPSDQFGGSAGAPAPNDHLGGSAGAPSPDDHLGGSAGAPSPSDHLGGSAGARRHATTTSWPRVVSSRLR